MLLRTRDARRHTYADYLTWPDDDRCVGLIDGIAYVREPPGPSRVHQEWVGELYLQVRAALEGKLCRAYVAPFDVRLPKSATCDDQIDTVVQPDMLIVCDLRKLDARGMCGAPDWVAEVLSPSTAGYDQVLKLKAYERAGVAEVWLVNPTDRTLAIYRLEAGRYGRPTPLELRGRTALTAVPAVTIDWDRIIDGLA
jgi:Uma2 family endonuclease